SLSPYTAEEVVTRDFLIKEKPDGIINIADGTNLERNLYLTLQLMELGLPMVLALNMMDEVTASGGSVAILELSKRLGIPVVPISASKNEGITELITQAQRAASQHITPRHMDFCTGEVHRAIHGIAHLIEDHAIAANLPLRFAATKLVEDDQPTFDLLGLNQNERETVVHITSEMEQALGTDREAALADMRYDFIEKITADTVVRPTATREQQRSVKIDNLLTHRHLAIPLFLVIMATIFWLTFGVIGSFLSGLMSTLVDAVTASASLGLTAYGINPVLHSLIIDGIFAGVGSVMSFLPTILVLFFFLSLLEDSGYMARVAFVMDKLLRKIGLSGKSFVPMLIGFGCTVPAVMSTRTLSSERDRKMTIILTPFMSCSAKLPVYALFTSVFFPKHGAVVMVFLYLLGMAVAVIYGLVLKSTVFKGSPVPFVMELPAYRLPSAKSIVLHIWDKAKDFIYRAFTVIFLATLIIWVLQSFDTRGNPVTDSAASMLAIIGGWISPIFAPLGFGNWMASTALVTGLTAKEAVVSTLAVLTGAGEGAALSTVLAAAFTPASALSFLTFTLLYMPCIAAFAAVRREYGSGLRAAAIMASQTGIAWVVALLVYRMALLLL
ncbi:MAG: ferrous iron transport protein B, partial [Angelakisella sp.]